ncbi:hypothetical protein PR202_ga16733 [Eleusine coracana subsp. coracana]|uniref:Fe2OG dioxygenase domain-containing protein n=1 Tax=Eleusine coracana subsp. coracana TaxID=191504 RepID=A0AAV5CNH9_ELECO|nr:hypothetical protein QOZ80_6AG0525050 [Eleusine coracana subsp. coracana]GJM99613.1 hypothetical protein PR202_ga16733 [Eleusine coracana subsp. coracana]
MAILDLDLAPTPPAHACGDDDHRLQRPQRHGKHQELVGEKDDELNLSKGVRHLCERGGITRLPARYVLPPSQRPASTASLSSTACRLPVIDLARLKNTKSGGDHDDRAAALAELDAACRDYGFFQVVNHGVEEAHSVLDVARRFFDLPSAERSRYASSDIRAPVRYGTSFNQRNDGVLCWRDFLKIVVDDKAAASSSSAWPDAPVDLREVVAAYARATRRLFRELMDAALEALLGGHQDNNKKMMLEEGSSQMLVVNCYPACPEPDLTLGMPPHSDYGLLTVLLQDQVKGLEICHHGRWVLVDPIPGALLVNIGDHFEIFSNGRYKSVLHRVRVNSERSRISLASLHSLPPDAVIAPAPELVDDHNPRRYMDTDFEAFLRYIASAEGNHKSFLHSRRIPEPSSLVRQ